MSPLKDLVEHEDGLHLRHAARLEHRLRRATCVRRPAGQPAPAPPRPVPPRPKHAPDPHPHPQPARSHAARSAANHNVPCGERATRARLPPPRHPPPRVRRNSRARARPIFVARRATPRRDATGRPVYPTRRWIEAARALWRRRQLAAHRRSAHERGESFRWCHSRLHQATRERDTIIAPSYDRPPCGSRSTSGRAA